MGNTLKARVWDGTVREFHPEVTPACAGKDVPYVEVAGTPDSEAREFQETYCVTCPILVQCARFAMNNEPYGTWGLTEHQRTSLGGVVASSHANRVPVPSAAIAELEDAGLDLNTIALIVSAAGPDNHATYDALRARRRQLKAAHEQRVNEAREAAAAREAAETVDRIDSDEMPLDSDKIVEHHDVDAPFEQQIAA